MKRKNYSASLPNSRSKPEKASSLQGCLPLEQEEVAAELVCVAKGGRRVPKFYEFFAGVGLARIGLSQAWECVWANDISPTKAKIYEKNFGDDHLWLGDVAQVNSRDLPSCVDMAWASFPCQDLSLAGWRKGMLGKRSGTFWAFWNLMRDLFDAGTRPPLIVLENVVGMLYGGDFSGLCEALSALGMQFGALVVDAQHFIPQSRPRVFIVAVDERVNCQSFTTKTSGRSPWFTKALHDAVAKLPPHLASLWRWWHLPTPNDQVVDVGELIEHNPTGVKWHSEEETSHILSMMNNTHKRKVQEALAQGGRKVGFLYRRTRDGKQCAEVRFDGIAGCLRTPKGGSSRQTVLIAENGIARTRLLSPREAARLMGVSDNFWLPKNYNDAYFAMGDAVAVPVVAWLSEHLLFPIYNKSHEHENINLNKKIDISRQIAESLSKTWGNSFL